MMRHSMSTGMCRSEGVVSVYFDSFISAISVLAAFRSGGGIRFGDARAVSR